jgi:DNA-binding response OmpR family regulator
MSHSILIVEDDRWLAQQQQAVLEKAGYRVYVSPHALAAMDAVDDVKPDCIILDILLPGTTGFTLLHELQSYADTGAIPIIVCSSLTPSLKKEDIAQYGVKRLLDKATMTPDDIVAAVRSVL